ncbi:MAG: hypothetical protein ACK5LZ_04965 [Anaerorhabdus sp.]
MKVKCEKCKQILNKDIAKAFEEYHVGHLECSECRKKNPRYISESDLLMFFACSATLYTLAVIAIYFLFAVSSTINPLIVLSGIFCLFILMYFLSKYITYYIYIMAPFKKGWQNIKLNEDAEGIAKRMKWQFIMFLLVALTLGSQPNLIMYCFLLLISFIILVSIKIRLALRNEKAQLQKNNTL